MASLRKYNYPWEGMSLTASSLVEVTVAMTIIVLAFGITLLVIINVSRSASTIQKVKSQGIAIALATEANQTKTFLDAAGTRGQLSYHTTFTSFNGNKKLILLKIEVSNSPGNILYEHWEIIYNP